MNCRGLKNDSVSFLVGGEAGQGITRSGSILGKSLMRGGLHVFGMNDYPSIIRGGHNFYILRVMDREVHSPCDSVDLLIALNKETVLLHKEELNEGGGVIYDSNITFEGAELDRDDLRLYPVPLFDIVKEIGGAPIIANTVALGAVSALVNLDSNLLKGVISDTFAGRERIIKQNFRAVEMGFDYVQENFRGDFPVKIVLPDKKSNRIMVTGNEAIALGAIKAGCEYYAAYPMTPASGILHYLAGKDTALGMVVIQSESEIAAMNMVVGAGYAGVRAMTATSGGGFCLMTEAIGLAGMTETPVVVMLGQRPGPSTGMATYSAQSDLLFAIHTSQGEFPRIVIAPADVDDCFYRTMEAFNLAEKYQVPVIIVTDKFIVESHKSTKKFDTYAVQIERGALIEDHTWTSEEPYLRYKITESGVSPRIILGTENATILANGNEHDEYGFTTIDPIGVVAMSKKRYRKLQSLKEDILKLEPVKVFGDVKADVTLVGWGSTKGPSLEAIRILGDKGVRARFVQVIYMDPFPTDKFKDIMSRNDKRILFETNVTAQLGKLIKLHTGYSFEHKVLKYNGRPFTPEEICAGVEDIL